MPAFTKALKMADALRGPATQSGRVDPRLLLGGGTIGAGVGAGSFAKSELERAQHEAAERKRKAEEQANK